MADDLTLPASGAAVGTDEVDLGGGLVHVQYVKLVSGAEDATDRIPGTEARGLAVDPRLSIVRLTATPALSLTAYAAKDAVGTLLTFAGAARAAGGSIRIESVQVVDRDQEMKDLDLVLFDRTITTPTDNAVFAPTDAELAYCIGRVPIRSFDWADFSTNAVAHIAAGLSAKLDGTALYGVLVARGAPTFTAVDDLAVTLTIAQD